ncbi:hypothetical protein EW026_g2329 [Hermanssonia centrifuga]|uniref:Cation-transporting ATPase n=1 Tax=Hermanssonia centrifuga TaxID=98765 RepID=A0A4S4KPM6_9APHY|nr:hypothetical protein EW026_g2329 [Hermanssonia centrifuga]
MNSLYTLGVRQTNSIQADLERLRNGDTSAALLGQISASLAAMGRTVDDYDSMAKREIIKAKQEKAMMRVQKFRSDYAELRTQFEKIKGERETASRSELFSASSSSTVPLSPAHGDSRRRFLTGQQPSSEVSESPFRGPTPLPQSSLREDYALREHSFIHNTDARLDDFLAQGRAVLDDLVDQRTVLKGTQKRLLDAANTLGLSRDVIGWIERRSTQDMYIFLAGSDYAIESDDEDERWGYASEEEDDSESDIIDDHRQGDSDSVDFHSIEEDSYPPSPGLALHTMTGPGDPIFGDEARIDMGELDLHDPPPPGPPSRQTIYITDEDVHIRFIGFETVTIRHFLWRMACVLTFGILGLLGHWFPRLWLRWVAKEKAFKDMEHGFVVIEVDTLSRPPSRTNGDANIGILEHLLVVDYRYARFALDPRTGLFNIVRNWRDPSWTGIQSVSNGLTQSEEEQRLALFGPNVIDIEGKSTVSLLIDEVIHPFYVFQIASIILWSLDDYYYYAFCIALISAISITTTLIETKKTISRMREMSRFSCPVNVFTDGIWKRRESTDLVPGDIVNLMDPPLAVFPADIFLLSGDTIVNESMLTGESVPVSKVPIRDEDIALWKEAIDVSSDVSKSFLYAGTRVIRVRGALTADGSSGAPALGLVVRTGFNTTKGALVRSMLFPKPIGFKFYRDSIRFILVLAGLAGLGFCASAVQFVRLGIKWHTIMLRALDLITVVVPPALPATLSIGTSFAIGRLRKLGIFCISPSRVNVGGRVNVCCFDKTGTLTEDGLDILGVRALERNAHRFGELIEDVHDLPSSRDKANFLHALATCHSLKMVDGNIIGDPLDVKMFDFTKWTLEEGHVAGTGVVKSRIGGARPAALVQTVVRPPGTAQFRVEDALRGSSKHAHFLELGVIRTFEFVSALRRMSVIVKRLKSSSMEIYVKGAPEVMGEICEPDSFPDDYDDLLSYYTKRGYRVIAMAGKSLEGLSWLKAQKMKREHAESGLKFLGLIIFENKLKPGTTPAIQSLRAAHLMCRMITGDNPLTAVSVARECGLVNQAAHIFSPVFVRGKYGYYVLILEVV